MKTRTLSKIVRSYVAPALIATSALIPSYAQGLSDLNNIYQSNVEYSQPVHSEIKLEKEDYFSTDFTNGKEDDVRNNIVYESEENLNEENNTYNLQSDKNYTESQKQNNSNKSHHHGGSFVPLLWLWYFVIFGAANSRRRK